MESGLRVGRTSHGPTAVRRRGRSRSTDQASPSAGYAAPDMIKLATTSAQHSTQTASNCAPQTAAHGRPFGVVVAAASHTPAPKGFDVRRFLTPNHSAPSPLMEPVYQQFNDLIGRMLQWEPTLRLKPSEALRHPFFSVKPSVVNSVSSPPPPPPPPPPTLSHAVAVTGLLK